MSQLAPHNMPSPFLQKNIFSNEKVQDLDVAKFEHGTQHFKLDVEFLFTGEAKFVLEKNTDKALNVFFSGHVHEEQNYDSEEEDNEVTFIA